MRGRTIGCQALLVVATSSKTHALDYTCDLGSDICPTSSDGVCDSNLGDSPSIDPFCQVGDCVDCNLCSQFDYDCYGCLTATGCFWCPGDGICNNSPSYVYDDVISTCTSADDYTSAPNTTICNASSHFFSDPLYSVQSWVFEQINILPVWEQGYFGEGIRVRFNDDGIDTSIPELFGRVDLNASCAKAAPLDYESNHGTEVASVLGASGDNGACAVGIAPKVSMSSCNLYALKAEESFSVFSYNLDGFDVSQNSLGIEACSEDNGDGAIVRRLLQLKRGLADDNCPFILDDATPCSVCDFTSAEVHSTECEQAIVDYCNENFEQEEIGCIDFLDLIVGGTCDYNRVPDAILASLGEGVRYGRDGKGVIYVFSSGNGYGFGDDVNFGGLTNSRLTITVGATGKDGFHASYSTSGAALFVSAPGGDVESISNVVTAQAGGMCDGTARGTSFSTPVVSGVVALVLEANPELTWRDVQGVLATTARMVESDSDTTLVVNGAGLKHSNLYGFGIVDAGSAVERAKNWTMYCPEETLIGQSGVINASIVDNSTETMENELSINASSVFLVESVVVMLDLTHFSRGDLEITLTSPSGTLSVLHPGKRPENSQLDGSERWKLMTVRNWGEPATGLWRLTIRDIVAGDLEDCVDAPFTSFFNDTTISCTYLASEGFCTGDMVDPEILESGDFDDLLALEVEGLTLEEACCSCGGGHDSTQYKGQLNKWYLVLYGNTPNCRDSQSPTVLSPQPTRAPTKAPRTTNKPVQPPIPSMKREKSERIATILATAVALLFILFGTWSVLRGPPSFSASQEQHDEERFRASSGVSV
eukprot:Nitzschia sp. Nitz4//scaffold272_size25479//1136//3663//NITZ4_008306-RA/size25479-augustus-gene-0.11-mRNA-1//1//CDS//3329545216//2113//frame0